MQVCAAMLAAIMMAGPTQSPTPSSATPLEQATIDYRTFLDKAQADVQHFANSFEEDYREKYRDKLARASGNSQEELKAMATILVDMSKELRTTATHIVENPTPLSSSILKGALAAMAGILLTFAVNRHWTARSYRDQHRAWTGIGKGVVVSFTVGLIVTAAEIEFTPQDPVAFQWQIDEAVGYLQDGARELEQKAEELGK